MRRASSAITPGATMPIKYMSTCSKGKYMHRPASTAFSLLQPENTQTTRQQWKGLGRFPPCIANHSPPIPRGESPFLHMHASSPSWKSCFGWVHYSSGGSPALGGCGCGLGAQAAYAVCSLHRSPRQPSNTLLPPLPSDDPPCVDSSK